MIIIIIIINMDGRMVSKEWAQRGVSELGQSGTGEEEREHGGGGEAPVVGAPDHGRQRVTVRLVRQRGARGVQLAQLEALPKGCPELGLKSPKADGSMSCLRERE